MAETKKTPESSLKSPNLDLGILLVHGIGEQPKGDTLVRFGEPIIEWVKRWIGENGTVDLDRATIQDDEKTGQPAHFVASVKPLGSASDALLETLNQELEHTGRTSAGSVAKKNLHQETKTPDKEDFHPAPSGWLLAESWWAPHFRRPRFSTFSGWLISRGPWIILTHYGSKLSDAEKWYEKIIQLFVYLLAIPAALLMQILVAVIAVLAVIPWPRLRNVLSGLLIKLTGTLGDSYVLIESPVQQSAAVWQVQKDLNWLAARCKTVIVIAHSQGTAIAREAIEKSDRDVSLFVTFGQGLKKLEELKYMTENWKTGLYSTLSYSLPLTAVVIFMSFFPPPGLDIEILGSAKYYLIAYPFFLLLTAVSQSISGSVGNMLSDLKLKNGTRWIDFFSSADPVPGGSLENDIPGVESTEINNFSSVMIDHTSYWKNIDQFVSPLMMEINKAAGNALFYGNDQLVNRISKQRPKRVRVLVLIRWMCFLSVPLAAWGLSNELAYIGQFLLIPLMDVPIVSTIVDLLLGIGKGIEQFFVTTSTSDGFAVIGITIISLFIYIWYLLTKRLWQTWDDLSIRPLFKFDTRGEKNQRKIVGVLVVIFTVIPFCMATASLFGSTLQDLLNFMWYSAWTIPMLLILIGFILLIFFAAWGAILKLKETIFQKLKSG